METPLLKPNRRSISTRICRETVRIRLITSTEELFKIRLLQAELASCLARIPPWALCSLSSPPYSKSSTWNLILSSAAAKIWSALLQPRICLNCRECNRRPEALRISNVFKMRRQCCLSRSLVPRAAGSSTRQSWRTSIKSSKPKTAWSASSSPRWARLNPLKSPRNRSVKRMSMWTDRTLFSSNQIWNLKAIQVFKRYPLLPKNSRSSNYLKGARRPSEMTYSKNCANRKNRIKNWPDSLSPYQTNPSKSWIKCGHCCRASFLMTA